MLEVFPTSRRVLITCHSPQAAPPTTYSLWGSQDIEVAKKVVKSRDPASFSINVTLKSRPDLLTYTCQAATSTGTRVASTKLQMYWELWASECWGWGLASGPEVAHLAGPPSAPPGPVRGGRSSWLGPEGPKRAGKCPGLAELLSWAPFVFDLV